MPGLFHHLKPIHGAQYFILYTCPAKNADLQYKFTMRCLVDQHFLFFFTISGNCLTFLPLLVRRVLAKIYEDTKVNAVATVIAEGTLPLRKCASSFLFSGCCKLSICAARGEEGEAGVEQWLGVVCYA